MALWAAAICPLVPPDTVKFGEVVLQPPELTARPRGSEARDQVWGTRGRGVTEPPSVLGWEPRSAVLSAVRPGRVLAASLLLPPQPGKKSLMLKTLLSPGGASQPLATSMARQRLLGEERERAVQAYRALKKLQQQRQQEALPSQPPSRTPRTATTRL